MKQRKGSTHNMMSKNVSCLRWPIFISATAALITAVCFASLQTTEAFVTTSIITRNHHRLTSRLPSSTFHEQDAYSDDNYQEEPPVQRKEYLATCIPGLAPYLEEELISLGASSTTQLSNAAVSFTDHSSDQHMGLKALLWLRTAHRVLEKIDTFYDVETRDDVYDAVQQCRMPVQSLLGDGQGGLLSLSVKVIANGFLPKDISHSHYTALTIKNALVDQVRGLRQDGERPDVDLEDPDVPLVAILHSQGTRADMTLYRSLSPPGSLHKRGYRAGGAIHKAAMKESLAAGLLLASGWMNACRQLRDSDGKQHDNLPGGGLTLVDPMCGSGSLILEAAMMAVDFAPGLMRVVCGVPGQQIPPVLRWKENKDTLVPVWKEMLLEASQQAKSRLQWIKDADVAPVKIFANDIHGGAMELLESSLAKGGGLNRIVDIHQNDCRDWKILCDDDNNGDEEPRQVWVAVNPPWGVRLSDDDHESWESLRTFLRSNCPPGRTQAWVLSGNKATTKHLGLRRSQSIALKTGQQDLRWIQYVILDKSEVAARQSPGIERRKEPQENTARKKTTRAKRVAEKPIPTRKIPVTTPITAGLSSDSTTTSLRISPKRTAPSTSRRGDDDSWV